MYYLCMYVCMCIPMYVYMYVCMYVCIYVCMYVYNMQVVNEICERTGCRNIIVSIIIFFTNIMT